MNEFIATYWPKVRAFLEIPVPMAVVLALIVGVAVLVICS